MNSINPIADYHDLAREDVLPLVPPTAGSVLDLGGGIGATAARLLEEGKATRAGVIDLVARPENGPKINFHHAGDIEDRRFLEAVIACEGPFDTILCLDILEHLRDPWATIATLHKGLRPGGSIVASIPNVRNFGAVMPLVLRNRWTLTDAGILDRTHLRFFVRSSAIELMTSSGLLLDEVLPKPSGGRKVQMFRAATLGLLNSFTDLQYLIRVRASNRTAA